MTLHPPYPVDEKIDGAVLDELAVLPKYALGESGGARRLTVASLPLAE
jgi:hypothetical protein